MKKNVLARFLGATGFRSIIASMTRWSGILALNYHRIGMANQTPFHWDLWSASTEDFDAQIEWLKSRFNLIGPDQLTSALESRKGQHVLITFDDGFRDNYTQGYQVLKRHNVPATFFIVSSFIDYPHLAWWDEISWMVRTSRQTAIALPKWHSQAIPFDNPDRIAAVRTLTNTFHKLLPSDGIEFLESLGKATETGRYKGAEIKEMWMTWDMIREMRAGGMTIGGHTMHHPFLSKLSREEQRKEIVSCGRRLADELGEPMGTFSYPFGSPESFNSDTRECLVEAGVRFAFSYYGGFRRFGDWDEYDVRRMAVESFMTRDYFKAMLVLPGVFGT
jgi:peptidoglycan/xylan/chitin deacetylase (PgdA/CDA1 family)